MNTAASSNSNYSKSRSLLICLVSYALTLAIGYYVLTFTEELDPIYSSLAADLVATLVIFLIGWWLSNASLYDPYWSIIPVALALYWWSYAGFEWEITRRLGLYVVVALWAIRLTLNWIRSWPGLSHEDWRYEMIREKTGKWYPLANLLSIHVFPTILVFVAMLPAFYVLTSDEQAVWNVIDWIALAVGLGGVLISLIADEQLKAFANIKREKKVTLKTGLWKYSRHPNYLGEFMFWLSLFLFAFAGSSAWLWTIVGPISILCLFLFASIPMMDKRMGERRSDYADYTAKTSSFILMPPKS